MNYLFINTAGKNLEIVVSAGGETKYFTDPDGLMSSAVLLPNIEKLMLALGTSIKDMDYLALVNGPGSFTGIRVGISTIKAFAFALDKPIIACTYNQLLANCMPNDTDKDVISVIDGGNNTFYVGACSFVIADCKSLVNVKVSELEALLDKVYNKSAHQIIANCEISTSKPYTKITSCTEGVQRLLERMVSQGKVISCDGLNAVYAGEFNVNKK